MFVLNGSRKIIPRTGKSRISNCSPIKVVQFPNPPLECTDSRTPGCSERGLSLAQFMAFSGNTRDFWGKKQVFGFYGGWFQQTKLELVPRIDLDFQKLFVSSFIFTVDTMAKTETKRQKQNKEFHFYAQKNIHYLSCLPLPSSLLFPSLPSCSLPLPTPSLLNSLLSFWILQLQ